MSFIPPFNYGCVVDGVYRSAIPNELNFPFLSRLHLKSIIVLSRRPPRRALQQFCEDEKIQWKHFGKETIIQPAGNNNNKSTAGGKSSSTAISSISSSGGATPAMASGASLNSLPAAPPAFFSSHSTPSAGQNPSSSTPSSSSDFHSFPAEFFPNAPANGLATAKLRRPAWHSLSEETIISALELILNPSCLPVLICCTHGNEYNGIIVACLRKILHWNFSSIFQEYRRFLGNQPNERNEQFIELFDTDLIHIPTDNIPSWYGAVESFNRGKPRSSATPTNNNGQQTNNNNQQGIGLNRASSMSRLLPKNPNSGSLSSSSAAVGSMVFAGDSGENSNGNSGRNSQNSSQITGGGEAPI